MRIYNSLTRKKELFTPLNNKKVLMYVCGVTPYDTTHLGHAFTYVFFDTLSRYLKHKGYEVLYTQNVTDIDDDILRKAKEENKNWKELGEYWTQRFLIDLEHLNVCMPTNYVKATNSIFAMIKIINSLILKGYAYEKNGNVYFEVNKFKDYGELSKLNRKQMLLISKERGGFPDDPFKKDPLDFLLWQKSKEGEPSWESPWEKGRPGWHIECSAMVKQYLGDQIDIHGGGRDLIYPHHESEIAQSESFTDKALFVKYWLHTSMLLCEGEKMSKSLGNLVMVDDLLKKYSANTIRWVLLSHHYRSPWEINEEELKKTQKTVDLIEKQIKNIKGDDKEKKTDNTIIKEFENALDDDMNTPVALSIIEKQIFKTNKNTLAKMYSILGFTL